MIPYLTFYDYFLKKNNHKITNPNLDLIEQSKSNENKIYLKHDVECKIESAIEMAIVETQNKVQSIWLFQKALLIDKNLQYFNFLIKQGHIIGYHYDVLDSNSGNYERALDEFNDVVDWFVKHDIPLKYVCPHGNPSKLRIGYQSNKDFWVKFSNKFDHLYDLVMDYNGEFYSDVSYGFYKIIRSSENKNDEVKHKINFLENDFKNLSLISLHSHRWSKRYLVSLTRYLIFKIIKSIYNKFSYFKIVKKIGNILYKRSKFI